MLVPGGRSAAVGSILALAMLMLAAGLLAIPVLTQSTAPRVQPITDPTQLRRLAFEDLKYAGAFRMPAGLANGDGFASSGGPIAFNPSRNSLFAGSRLHHVAEVTIPTPLITSDINALPSAEYLQPFYDPTDGRMKEVAEQGTSLSGLLVHNDRLYGTGLIFYDANNTQTVSHFSRPLTLAERGASPMRSVWRKGRTGFVAGYLARVPPEWQSKLGGPAITGQCCVPIVTRTSWGPAAFAWDPTDVAQPNNKEINAIPLVYYPAEHQTLGPWSGSNPTYGGTIQMGGVALIDRTSTAVFVGRNGTGPYCYGIGTNDKSLTATKNDKGETLCYDPATSDKGQHAYPYRYQMWAYDLNEWAEVAAGKRDPWSVKPYGVWPFDLPFPEANTRINGLTFDPATRRLFVGQRSADRDGQSYRPIIHVFEVP